MQSDLQRLANRFRLQEEFATDYSPLYARIFGLVAGWLESPAAAEDPLLTWLVGATRHRRSLDVTLLLAAGLHREVLAGHKAAAELAAYFPTAGGDRPPTDPDFERALRETILLRRQHLEPFIQGATVQTNETGRGLCWLLPLSLSGWQRVQLVDLGASAGLNLVAERRAYRLLEAGSGQPLLDLALGQPVQFVTHCRGDLTVLVNQHLPTIDGRIGCDLAPFSLTSKDDELTLTSFVWGDQVARVQRLWEGIEAFHQVERSEAPVRLFEVDLPVGLNRFLGQHVPAGPATSVLIYNTWMTSYLHDKGESLMFHIDQWAVAQQRPVLWLQWEPPRDGSQAPEYGWCAWTADLWHQGKHRHWLLGWAHPHGGQAEFTTGLAELKRYLS